MNLRIDGKYYSALVTELRRGARIQDSPRSGKAISCRMVRDLEGTYYDYSVTIATDALSISDYDAMYEVLTAPVESHTVEFPYGQRTLVFDACIETVYDTLLDTAVHNHWGDLTVTFVAQRPQRRP